MIKKKYIYPANFIAVYVVIWAVGGADGVILAQEKDAQSYTTSNPLSQVLLEYNPSFIFIMDVVGALLSKTKVEE